MKFYVYEWFRNDNMEVFYVGKGIGNRYKSKKKNKMFEWYTNKYDCSVRIVKYFDDEDEAFNFESLRITSLKSIGQACCNVYTCRTGGVQSVWTKEKRLNQSINNPMKDIKQRNRMSENNPMRNKKIALLNGESHMKPCIINNKRFNSLKEAGLFYGVTKECIGLWIKKGKSSKAYGEFECKYDNQQPSIEKPVEVSMKVQRLDGEDGIQ